MSNISHFSCSFDLKLFIKGKHDKDNSQTILIFLTTFVFLMFLAYLMALVIGSHIARMQVRYYIIRIINQQRQQQQQQQQQQQKRSRHHHQQEKNQQQNSLELFLTKLDEEDRSRKCRRFSFSCSLTPQKR
ncbi:hypothetical protein HUG17_7299 [Dermatophagoides farinae]|nr:hypothetical protein HUG17_7299 [Dermatophagoides farinae]